MVWPAYPSWSDEFIKDTCVDDTGSFDEALYARFQRSRESIKKWAGYFNVDVMWVRNDVHKLIWDWASELVEYPNLSGQIITMSQLKEPGPVQQTFTYPAWDEKIPPNAYLHIVEEALERQKKTIISELQEELSERKTELTPVQSQYSDSHIEAFVLYQIAEKSYDEVAQCIYPDASIELATISKQIARSAKALSIPLRKP